MTETQPKEAPTACCPRVASNCEWLALVVGVVALVGSLHLSMGLKLQACPLCIYERTFLMGVISVLGLCGLVPLLRDTGIGARLALPLAIAGLGVAAFHVRLELVETLVCPISFFGLGTAPKQSLAAFLLICGFLFVAIIGPASDWQGRLAWMLPGIVLGGLFTYASIASGPPLPPANFTASQLRQQQQELKLESCKPVKHD